MPFVKEKIQNNSFIVHIQKFPNKVSSEEAVASIRKSYQHIMRVHEVYDAIFGILTTILQVMLKGENPFETHPVKMVALIVARLWSGMALCPQISLEEQNSDSSNVMKHYALLFGVLPIILVLLMLIPILGCIGVGICVCWFVAVTFCFRRKLKEFLDQVVDTVRNMFRNQEL